MFKFWPVPMLIIHQGSCVFGELVESHKHLQMTWRRCTSQCKGCFLSRKRPSTQEPVCMISIGTGQKLNIQGGWTYIHTFHSNIPSFGTFQILKILNLHPELSLQCWHFQVGSCVRTSVSRWVEQNSRIDWEAVKNWNIFVLIHNDLCLARPCGNW